MSNDDLLILADELYDLLPEDGTTLGRTKALKALECSVEDYLAAKKQLVIEGRAKVCKGRCGPIARVVLYVTEVE